MCSNFTHSFCKLNHFHISNSFPIGIKWSSLQKERVNLLQNFLVGLLVIYCYDFIVYQFTLEIRKIFFKIYKNKLFVTLLTLQVRIVHFKMNFRGG
jgi:hypothetical protein